MIRVSLGFEPGSQEISKISKLSECHQKPTLNRKSGNIGILMITWVRHSNHCRLTTNLDHTIYNSSDERRDDYASRAGHML